MARTFAQFLHDRFGITLKQCAEELATVLPGLGDSITESELSLSDVTTGDASETKHGFLPKLSGDDAEFLAGDGTWKEAGGGGGSPNITIPMLLSSTTVNLNEGTGAKQTLYTCPANRRCIIVNVVMQKPSASEIGTALVRIGWNVAGNNVMPSYDFSAGPLAAVAAAVQSIPDFDRGYLVPTPTVGTAGDTLGLVVATPEGSALTAKVDVYGYWTDTNGVPIANVVGVAP